MLACKELLLAEKDSSQYVLEFYYSAIKAKQLTLLEEAVKFLEMARLLLPSTEQSIANDLTWKIEIELAECLFLANRREDAERLLNKILQTCDQDNLIVTLKSKFLLLYNYAGDYKKVVEHKKLILPQLGAPGIAAHEVKKRSGFNIEYGPVRAADLQEYLTTHDATLEMRQVYFTLRDRLILVPVELVGTLVPIIISAVLLFFIGGILPSAAAITAILAGAVLFPILLPISFDL